MNEKEFVDLLEAWHGLDLKDAELWLLGSVHDEAKPHLKKLLARQH